MSQSSEQKDLQRSIRKLKILGFGILGILEGSKKDSIDLNVYLKVFIYLKTKRKL